LSERAAVATRSCRRREHPPGLPALLWIVLAWLPGSVVLAASLERHEVVVEGHPMAVWEKAPPAPEAVMLLIHGRTWSTRPDFDLSLPGESLSLMDGLVDRGMAVYGLDLRGYGDTPRDSSGWLTPEQAAADVVAVLDWIRARHPASKQPYLFGWSYGAMVAQLAVQSHPDKVGGLILFGYPVRPGIDQSPVTSEPERAPTTEAQARSDFLLDGTISQAAMDAFVASALRHDPVRMDWRSLEQWRRLDAGLVRRPTLLLQAEHDPLALPEVHAALFAGLATADKAWVVIPGGDHAAFMETPRSYFLRQIETFVFR
jgi:pimeloyl-ACP methyl ester carboxylesterase